MGLIQNLEIIKGEKPLNRVIKDVLCNEKYLKKKGKICFNFLRYFFLGTREKVSMNKTAKSRRRRDGCWLMADG